MARICYARRYNLQAERSLTEKAPEFDLQLKYWMAVHCLPLAAYFNSVQPHIMKSWVYSTIYAIGDLVYDIEIPNSWNVMHRKPHDVSHDGREWSEEMMLYDFAIYFVCHNEGKANAWTQQKKPWDGVYGPVGPGWNNTAWDHRPDQAKNSASDIVPKLVDYVYTCLNVLCNGRCGLPLANPEQKKHMSQQLNIATLWLPNCASKYWLGCWDLIEAMYVKGIDLIFKWNDTPWGDDEMFRIYDGTVTPNGILKDYPAGKKWYESNKDIWNWTAEDIDRMWMQRRPIQQIYVTNIAGVRKLIAYVDSQKITLLEMWTRVASNSIGELLPYVSDWFFNMEREMFKGFEDAAFKHGHFCRSRNEINRRAFASASRAMDDRISEIYDVLAGQTHAMTVRDWNKFRNGEYFIKKGKETTDLTWEVLTNTEDHYTAWKQWKTRDGEGLDTPKRNPQHDVQMVTAAFLQPGSDNGVTGWTKAQITQFAERAANENRTWAGIDHWREEDKVMMHINGLRRMICDGCGAPCCQYGSPASSPFSKYQASCYRCRRRNGQNTHEGAHKEIDATQQFQIIATLFFQKLVAADSYADGQINLALLFELFHTGDGLQTRAITFNCPAIEGAAVNKTVISAELTKTETTSWKSVIRDVINVGKTALNQHPFIHADLGKIHGLADRIGDTTTAGINLKGVMEHVLTHGIPKPERCRQAAPKPTLEETVTAWANAIVYGLYGGCGGGLAENPSMLFFAPNPRDKILSIIPDGIGTLRKLNRTYEPITDLRDVAHTATIMTMAGLLRDMSDIETYNTMRKEFEDATVAFFDKMITSMQNGGRYNGAGNGRQRLDQHEADRRYRDFLLGHKILDKTYRIREPFDDDADLVHKIDINGVRGSVSSGTGWVFQIRNSIHAFWPDWNGDQRTLITERQELREADRFLPKILRFDKLGWSIKLSDHRINYMKYFDNLDADSEPWYPYEQVVQRVEIMLNNLYIRKNGRWQIRYVNRNINERKMFEKLYDIDSGNRDARDKLFNKTKIEDAADGDEALELWNEDLTKDRNCDFLGRPTIGNPWGINQAQVDEAEDDEDELEELAEQIWDTNIYPFRLLVWAIGRKIDDNRLREQFVPLGANNNNRLAYAENNVTSITGGLTRPAYLIWTSADLRTIENMKDLGSYLCPFQVEKPTIMPSSSIYQILTEEDAYEFAYGPTELEDLFTEAGITFSYGPSNRASVKMPNYYLLTSAYTIHKWNHYHKIENYMAKVRNIQGVEIGWGSADPLRALERGPNNVRFRSSLADENPGGGDAFGVRWVDEALQIPAIEGDALRPHSQYEIFMDGILHVNHGPLDENLMLKNAGGKSSSGWNNEMRKMFVGWYRALSGARLDLTYPIIPPGIDRSSEQEKAVASFPRSYIIHRTLESMKEYDILQYLSNVSKGTAQAKIVVTTKRRNDKLGVFVNGGIVANGNGGYRLITKCESNVNVLFNEDPARYRFSNRTIKLYFFSSGGTRTFNTAQRIVDGYRTWYPSLPPGKQKEYWPPDKHALVLIYQQL